MAFSVEDTLSVGAGRKDDCLQSASIGFRVRAPTSLLAHLATWRRCRALSERKPVFFFLDIVLLSVFSLLRQKKIFSTGSQRNTRCISPRCLGPMKLLGRFASGRILHGIKDRFPTTGCTSPMQSLTPFSFWDFCLLSILVSASHAKSGPSVLQQAAGCFQTYPSQRGTIS
ncbi:MAG: uncharacterized protein A8A55_2633 [Amphiamblys sp. WSBS2006]|nr:MAG: uncharacterized protein A8A55_2633 [Amphiamblys sp. WSBS2006]